MASNEYAFNALTANANVAITTSTVTAGTAITGSLATTLKRGLLRGYPLLEDTRVMAVLIGSQDDELAALGRRLLDVQRASAAPVPSSLQELPSEHAPATEAPSEQAPAAEASAAETEAAEVPAPATKAEPEGPAADG